MVTTIFKRQVPRVAPGHKQTRGEIMARRISLLALMIAAALCLSNWRTPAVRAQTGSGQQDLQFVSEKTATQTGQFTMTFAPMTFSIVAIAPTAAPADGTAAIANVYMFGNDTNANLVVNPKFDVPVYVLTATYQIPPGFDFANANTQTGAANLLYQMKVIKSPPYCGNGCTVAAGFSCYRDNACKKMDTPILLSNLS